MKIARKMRLGMVTDYDEEGFYLASKDMSSLAVNPLESARDLSPKETKTPNGITLYGSPAVAAKLQTVIESYPNVWIDSGKAVDVPESEWLRIPLIKDWESKHKLSTKVYPLSPKDRALVDELFDELHEQDRMKWTPQGTPFGFPVFVVWKTILVGPEKTPVRKGRVVVDIRGLNQISVPDSYPLPLQTDIISAVMGSNYISTVDCSSFFYQWRVAPEDIHKLTVVSHRGQESFKVAVMGYRNSPPYVQRQMDRILRPIKEFAKGYIDDVVIFSKTLDDHIEHLHQLFSLFQGLNICLKPSKSYLGYPSITLLGQKVDGLGMSTSAEKLAAIQDLTFPESLKELERYLGLTGWLRSYIPRYAQKVEPLQKRKTMLLRQSPSKGGNVRKSYSKTTRLNAPTDAELKSFDEVQTNFRHPRFLHHFNPERRLYVDLDASKERGFGVMVYHIKGDEIADKAKGIPGTSVEPIMFLSKLLSDAERNYWPTELEVAGLVWTIKKIPHMIEVCTRAVIVFTDHAATVGIAVQSNLSTTNSDKLNLRLIRASQYLSQFNLGVRHKPSKEHIVPDALSRLPAKGNSSTEDTLDDLDAYLITLVSIEPKYKEQII